CQIADYNNQPLFGNGIQIASETDTYTAKPQQRLVGNVIRNNIVVNARVGLFYGSYGYAAGGGDGMRDTLIVNNIFVGNRENAITLQAGLRSPHSNNIIANNLFYWSGVLAPWVVSVDDGGGFGFLHNLWFGLVPGAAAGAGDVLADPRLANSGGTAPSAFIPATTSPARGAANPAFRPPNDFSGTVRPAPGDIGAFVIP
ncbi:MAG: hypothetical protein H7267_07850, partial [Sandarakinorhabdus sp.]|nr:hypothetical protein [Sandarakinorhabdus sp.]